MTSTLLCERHSVLRQRMLGTVALYRVISDDGSTVTAEVVEAPGLTRGTRVRLMARAARAMERLDASEGLTSDAGFEGAVPVYATPAGAAA